MSTILILLGLILMAQLYFIQLWSCCVVYSLVTLHCFLLLHFLMETMVSENLNLFMAF